MAVSLKIYQRETIELDVEKREERGKGPVGRLRREQGMLPGVIYGHQCHFRARRRRWWRTGSRP